MRQENRLNRNAIRDSEHPSFIRETGHPKIGESPCLHLQPTRREYLYETVGEGFSAGSSHGSLGHHELEPQVNFFARRYR